MMQDQIPQDPWMRQQFRWWYAEPPSELRRWLAESAENEAPEGETIQ